MIAVKHQRKQSGVLWVWVQAQADGHGQSCLEELEDALLQVTDALMIGATL